MSQVFGGFKNADVFLKFVKINLGIRLIFYASNEAEAKKYFYSLKDKWNNSYPKAVNVIEKDLDSLLRFFQFHNTYWTVLRTTNPIERLNKEIKRRTKPMEITGGEDATYRIIAYVAKTMNYKWHFHPVTQWSHNYYEKKLVYTQKAA